MSARLRLLGTVAGVPTEFDGAYVRAYDPAHMIPVGRNGRYTVYDGGKLEVTKDLNEAKVCADGSEQQYCAQRSDEDNGYYCTRPVGHDDDHVAHDTEDVPVYRWPQTPEVPA
jgi:hypothetical protein